MKGIGLGSVGRKSVNVKRELLGRVLVKKNHTNTSRGKKFRHSRTRTYLRLEKEGGDGKG